MFKRIGGPVNIELVNFKKSEASDITCKHCGKAVGRRNGKFVKFAGSNAVLLSPIDYMCPKCGEKNKGV